MTHHEGIYEVFFFLAKIRVLVYKISDLLISIGKSFVAFLVAEGV